MRKCLILMLANRETPAKTTRRNLLTPVRMAIKERCSQRCGGNGAFITILAGG
jgi:hypothetical protein